MNAADILSALADPSIAMSRDDLDAGYRLLKARSGANAQLAVSALTEGDTVAFNGRGGVLVGTVIKINQKTVSVRVGMAKWRVDGSLVHKATQAEIDASASPVNRAIIARQSAIAQEQADARSEARAEALAS